MSPTLATFLRVTCIIFVVLFLSVEVRFIIDWRSRTQWELVQSVLWVILLLITLMDIVWRQISN